MSEQVRKWKRGDVHPDTGLVFKQYDYRRGCREVWITPERFSAQLQTESKPRDKAIQKWKRGDVHPETGLVFLKYRGARESWGRREKLELENAMGLSKYHANRDKRREYARRYQKQFPNRVAEKSRRWRQRNLTHSRTLKRMADKRRLSTPLGAMKKRVRDRIAKVIRRGGYKKPTRSIDITGCDWATLKAHLEARFPIGMTWENRSLWHIDHIVPLASAQTLDEILSLCHFSNLQPLWAPLNLSKGARRPSS